MKTGFYRTFVMLQLRMDMKKLLWIGLALFALGAGVLGWGYHQIDKLTNTPIIPTQDNFITIERGTTGQRLGNYLVAQGVIKEDQFFPYLLRLRPELSRVKAGTYSLAGITTLKELLQHLVAGKEAHFSVRFAEGETFSQLLNRLKDAPYLTQTLQDKNEAEIYEILGISTFDSQSTQKVEGWIYPDTYHYTANMTDIDLLKRASQRMQTTLQQVWEGRAEGLPLKHPYEMLILASIVEKETGIADEREKVAAVFINRLRLNMRLQADPTIIYGMGERYQGRIGRADIDEKTAYNTYQIDGLPPTPISMLSEASLRAVAHPADIRALYFVADGTGGHIFSNTLKEHNQAVKDYLKWLKGRRNAE